MYRDNVYEAVKLIDNIYFLGVQNNKKESNIIIIIFYILIFII